MVSRFYGLSLVRLFFFVEAVVILPLNGTGRPN